MYLQADTSAGQGRVQHKDRENDDAGSHSVALAIFFWTARNATCALALICPPRPCGIICDMDACPTPRAGPERPGAGPVAGSGRPRPAARPSPGPTVSAVVVRLPCRPQIIMIITIIHILKTRLTTCFVYNRVVHSDVRKGGEEQMGCGSTPLAAAGPRR